MGLLQMSLSGAVMIAAILIVRAAAVNRLPKVTFLILWEIAILRLLIPFSFPSSVSVYALLGDSRAANAIERVWKGGEMALTQDVIFAEREEAEENAGTEGILGTAGANADVEGISGATAEDVGAGETINSGTTDIVADEALNSGTLSATNRMATVVSAFFSVTPARTLVWLAGVLACAAFFMISYVRSRRKFSFSTPVQNACTERWLSQHKQGRTISIRQTDLISAPLTYGIFRPVILMPAETDWEDARHLDYIFAHEYSHIRHYDTLKKLICVLALCIHWFNPFVWVLYLLYNRDIELACDESVILSFGESSRREYSLMLLNMEAKKSGLLPFCNHFSKNSIEERIRAIMKTKKMTVGMIAVSVVIVVVIAALFATSASNVTESPQTAEADETENAGAEEALADADGTQDQEGSGTEASGSGTAGTENTDAGTETAQADAGTVGTDDLEGDVNEEVAVGITGLIVSEEENPGLYEQVLALLDRRDYLESEMYGAIDIDLSTTITVDGMTYCLVTEEGITSFSDYEALAKEIYTEDYVERLFTPLWSEYFVEADGSLYRVAVDGFALMVDEEMGISIYENGGSDGVYTVIGYTAVNDAGTRWTLIFLVQENGESTYGFEIRDVVELN